MLNPVIYWQDPDTENKIIHALQDNKVLITTTDTIPGFLANTTAQGFAALNSIKGGRQNKPYIILIDNFRKLDYFVDQQQITPQVKKLVNKFWPGPLTIIFKAKKELPNFLKSEQETVAIRCPNQTHMLRVLKHFNGLYSTSANRSSDPAPMTIDSVNQQVALKVAYLVEDKEQKTAGKPSTIIDVSNPKKICIVRQGAYPIQDLEKILGKL